MREHQERVNKIPGAPKLLPKRDVGRFVEQPYNDEAAPHAIPKTFKMPPYLKIYDRTTDPEFHVTHYVTAVKGNDLTKEQVSSILLKRFGETLTGGALTWYSQLLARSIKTFEEMADKFVTAHAGAKKAQARVNNIFAIKQSPREGLRDFLTRFNRVRMTLPNVSEGMVVAAFQNGLNRNGSRATRKLLNRLMKYPPTTWDEIHNAYCAGEDDLNGPTHRLTSVQAETRKDRRNDAKRDLTAPQSNRERHKPYVRSAIMPLSRYEEGPSRPRTGTHRNERVREKVEKLLENGSIRESKYPQWVANVVMVKRKNGKWWMCVDFTDLNKTCPKEFPLPHIGQLIDAMAGHELLSILDAYSSYNQILMEEEDHEKTTFVTHQGTYSYRVMPFELKNAGAK
uniref:Retrotransposon gag domain-containing protein n=1 Tax=Nicotiana tabacum TaxID=4097 RepID=A0A1S4AMF5_TOBAC|nr:PREDICTED: uncharacterized protein LOC107799244 [Nicotiana tabacum]